MTDWNHKAVTELAGAIKRCEAQPGWTAQQQQQLSRVAAAAHSAKWELNATSATISRLREQLCLVCRREGLYACDQPTGWSDDCRLMIATSAAVVAEAIAGRPVSAHVVAVNSRRQRVTELVEQLDKDPAHSITDEDFMVKFSRLQVVLAEFFAREEEVIAMIGMPDSEKRRHILEHDRLLAIFHDIYMDSMNHKNTMAVEVYRRVKAEVMKHLSDYDARLAAHIAESPL